LHCFSLCRFLTNRTFSAAPLLLLLLQLFGLVLGVAWPGMSKVLALNLFMMGLTTTMAVLGVPVGDVLRYVLYRVGILSHYQYKPG
jgi:hypothetical protein